MKPTMLGDRSGDSHSPAIGVLAILAAVVSCSDPAPPSVTVESIALSLDSIAIQFRDSASELTASPRGALGLELDATVMWRSKDANIVVVVPNGKVARLIPVRPGSTEVEATAESQVATAKVVVLDTVFSVQITADTIVTMGQSLQFTATVSGPPGAPETVVWSVGNSAVASIDSSKGKNPVLIVSRDTGSTDITATSAVDRKKAALARFRTARPASLFFDAQPEQSTTIRANDVMIPGPIVKARDVLGNVFPGSTTIAMAITPGTGASGASLFGALSLSTGSGDARFDNLGVDLPATGYRLTATSPGLAAATSTPFTVDAECAGTPYTIGSSVSGNLTESDCQSRADQYYDRYIVTSPIQQFFTIRIAQPHRVGIVFPDGTRAGPTVDSLPVVAAAGTYSVRVYSSANGQTGPYQLQTHSPNLPKGVLGASGYICWRIQVTRGVVFQEELRCANVGFPCGIGPSTVSPYRLFLPANVGATITASSTAFDPCLEVLENEQRIAVDDDGGGGTTARIVIAPGSIARSLILNVTARPPVPAFSPFTITIQP